MRRKEFFSWMTLSAFCFSTFSTTALAQQVPQELIQYPELIVHNAMVLTLDAKDTVAQAVAIRDGKFLAVGTNAQVLRLAGPKTLRLDAKGETVMPGIINTHIHPNRQVLNVYFDEFPPEVQNLLRASGRVTKPRDKADALAQISNAARTEKGPWVKIGGSRTDLVLHELRIADLDAAVPDKPLLITLSGWWGIINSKALAELKKRYPAPTGLVTMAPDHAAVPKHAASSRRKGTTTDEGTFTGHIMGTPFWLVREELIPKPTSEFLAPYMAKFLKEQLVPAGMTTMSTRLSAHEIRAYRLADREGKLPMRIAFGHEVGRWNPIFERDMQRVMTDIMDYGNDMMWLSSISIGIPDSNPLQGAGAICSTFPKLQLRPGEGFPDGVCLWDIEGDPTKETILAINRLGYRVGNTHTYGDLGLQMAIDTLEVAKKERPIYELTALDHSQLFNPTVIKKSGELGMIWSLNPGMFAGARSGAVEGTYGKEVANRMLSPVKSLLDAGALVSYEGEEGTENPFISLEILVRRETARGHVLGEREKVDRRTALRIMTEYGAKYVLKEKEIGSIEVGKWADLIVVDKNPLDPKVPDNQLGDLMVNYTIVGGKIMFDHTKDPRPKLSRARGADNER
jgi:predicted amidohydrolase YtcJ